MSERIPPSRRLLGAIGAGLTAAGEALRGEDRKPSGLAEPERWFDDLVAPTTAAGVRVSEGTAMRLAAHFACVSIVARTLASLPIHVYERLPDGRKRKAVEHPVYRLLHDQPNPEMTAMTFKEAMQGNLSNTGKAFAEIVWSRSGYPAELWPIEPGRVGARRRQDGKLEYLVDGDVLPNWKILHIPGLGFDGLNSFSPVGLFRQTIGLGLAAEQFGARFFGQGTHIGGFLTHPKNLGDDAFKRLKASMDEKYKGLQNSHGLVILEEGMTYAKIGMSMEDAQFIETQKLNRSTIAMIHGVPPHLIGDLEKATFSNIEHQGIEAVVYLFRPWAVRWEQALTSRLFTPKEQEKFYVKVNLDGLLRGDTAARYAAYAVGRQWGWLSADDIREKEDMDPLPDDSGKVYLQPLNMVPAGSSVTMRDLARSLFEDVQTSGRAPPPIAAPEDLALVRREICARDAAALLNALHARGKEELAAVLRRVYDGLAETVKREVAQPSGDASRFLADYGEALSRRGCAESPAAVQAELHRMRNAFLRELYRNAGVRNFALAPGSLFRSAIGERRVGVDKPFFEKGEELHDGDLSVTTEYRVWNPPVFVGDDSEIIPVLEEGNAH